jgi:hypothetical protein
MIPQVKDLNDRLISIPDHARVWIYQSDRQLNDSEVSLIKQRSKVFLSEWNAHGAALRAELSVFYHRFIVIIADETAVKASGCSIDSSVRFIKSLESELGIDLFNRLNLAYRDQNGEIKSMMMSEFEQAAAAGEISKDTVVFDNTVSTVGQLKTRWELPASGSWHARFFQ